MADCDPPDERELSARLIHRNGYVFVGLVPRGRTMPSQTLSIDYGMVDFDHAGNVIGLTVIYGDDLPTKEELMGELHHWLGGGVGSAKGYRQNR